MDNKKLALLLMMRAVVETVEESGVLGAPAGPMYAAFMTKGMTLEQFQNLTGAIKSIGLIRESGHCFFITEAGLQWLKTQKAA